MNLKGIRGGRYTLKYANLFIIKYALIQVCYLVEFHNSLTCIPAQQKCIKFTRTCVKNT